MKKLILLFFFILTLSAAQGQILISLLFGDKLNSDKIEFGLDGGLNITKLSGFQSAKPLAAFNLGFYFDIKIKNQWFLTTGVQVKSNVGLDGLKQADVAILDPTFTYSDSGTFRQEVTYFHIASKTIFMFMAVPYLAFEIKQALPLKARAIRKT